MQPTNKQHRSPKRRKFGALGVFFASVLFLFGGCASDPLVSVELLNAQGACPSVYIDLNGKSATTEWKLPNGTRASQAVGLTQCLRKRHSVGNRRPGQILSPVPLPLQHSFDFGI